jgi:L-malate glycosyltransferase
MRLVLACLPSLGGSAITAVALAEALAARGHTVALVAAGPPFATGADRTEDAGSTTVAGVRHYWPACTPHAVLGSDTLATLRVAELVGVVARDLDADVVNVHYLGGLLPACALSVAALSPRAVLVASAHGTDVTDPADGTVALTAALLRSSTAVTAVSPYLATVMQATFGLPSDRVRVIPNWVEDPPPFDAVRRSPAPASPSGAPPLTMVHASNFRPVKRATRCADALASVATVSAARLVLVGDGPDRSRVVQRAAELGVGHLVDIVGVVDPATAFRVLAGSDLVLLPSASEACSGVLLQAMSAGLPAVAYDVGGNAGLVTHARSGLLVADEDGASAFAAAATELAVCPALRHSLGGAARHEVARFTKDRTVEGYESVFRTALAKPSRRTLRAVS